MIEVDLLRELALYKHEQGETWSTMAAESTGREPEPTDTDAATPTSPA